jgi:L-malate glycosyltransferase
MDSSIRSLVVLHIISGDRWAGAEAQAHTLLKYLQLQVILHVVLMNEGELARRLRQQSISVTVLPENELSSFTILKRLTQFIHKIKPDIIHTHRQKENILGNIANFMAFPLPTTRPKSVRTTHGAPEFVPTFKQKIQVGLDRWIGKYLQQAVIAVSDDLANKLRNYFPSDHIHVINNGVDANGLLENLAAAEFKLAFPRHKHIGIVGRLESVKRIDIFIDMVKLLLKENQFNHSIKFHIIGEGILRESLEQRVNQLGISSYLQFHGQRNDMAACVSSLDIVVMCSDHEGTPMTALEAIVLGTPLIAHDVGGLHELLVDYPQFLVSDHSAQGYAEKIKEHLTHNFFPPTLNDKYKAEVNAAGVMRLYNKLKKR